MAQEIADSTLLDTWASSGNITEPDISKIIEGWQLGEQPPHEYMNWLQNTFGSKLNHILKNGVANWNNTTPYLAGSSVQHTGNIWLCKTTNTNSTPTDANSNWKRIVTVESLTTILDNSYVATTKDQTIAGVKTFSSSPIVPTPTTGTQVANKQYVEEYAMNRLTTNASDLDALYAPGTYITSPSTTGQPLSSWGILLVMGTSIESSITTQIISYVYNSGLYTRTRANGVWSNWGKHVTETELSAKDTQNVKLTGNQTIAGVKTFSSSPIVPTPTTGTQAVNKDYADLKVALASFIGTNQSLSGSGYQKLPGGLIMQWGTTASIPQDNTGVAVTFPIAFTTACYSVTTAFTAYAIISSGTQGVGSISTTSFTVFNGGDVAGSFMWIAVGK